MVSLLICFPHPFCQVYLVDKWHSLLSVIRKSPPSELPTRGNSAGTEALEAGHLTTLFIPVGPSLYEPLLYASSNNCAIQLNLQPQVQQQ
ncbi:unnamed protein product, partial [Protopolystoma xenopodis]